MDKNYTVLGFMSGTSMDGIDAALIETDGENTLVQKGGVFRPYEPDMRASIEDAVRYVQQASSDMWPFNADALMPDEIKRLRVQLVEAHALLASLIMDDHGLDRHDIDLVGYHGQTLIHQPEIGFTYQLTDGKALAERTKLKVVTDLRLHDMENGGEGAPLAPIYHKALVNKFINEGKIEPGPYVLTNIGGVANVTFIDETGDLVAFDTGPGNALLDDWVRHHTGASCDKDGEHALAGKYNEACLNKLCAHKYFKQSPPKSIDRDLFKEAIALLKESNVSLQDGAATLAAFTARGLAKAATYFSQTPKGWIISGGGQHNPAILQNLQKEVTGTVVPSDKLGINGDLVEAECFAYLAVRSIRDLPISFPGTTGVNKPLCGGVLHTP